jgi:hypothetical protein
MHTIEAGATYHRPTSSTAFEWSRYGKLHSKFKLNLRHLFSNLDFAGLVDDAPLLEAVALAAGTSEAGC